MIGMIFLGKPHIYRLWTQLYADCSLSRSWSRLLHPTRPVQWCVK